MENNTDITVIEPEEIAANNNLDVIKSVDWDGLGRFTETYARTLKEAYNAGLEAGKNTSKNVNGNVSKKANVSKAEFFCAVADDKAYAVYTSEEKINNQIGFWNRSNAVSKEFGKGQYEEAVAWAMAEVSRLSGVPMQQIPPLPSVNYRTKVK